jgi:hypothetical protein
VTFGVLGWVWVASGVVWLSLAADAAVRGHGSLLVVVMLVASVAMFAVAVTSESRRRERLKKLTEVSAQLDAVEERLRRAVHGQ